VGRHGRPGNVGHGIFVGFDRLSLREVSQNECADCACSAAKMQNLLACRHAAALKSGEMNARAGGKMSRRVLNVMCSGKKLGKGAQYYAMM
jgi:hypothetical protein